MTVRQGLPEILRSVFLDNLGLKLISFLFALTFYAFIHGAENAVRTFSVSVVHRPPPASAKRVLVSQIPSTVAVRVRGSKTQLEDLRAEDFGTIDLDLSGGHETRIDLGPTKLHVPAGVAVEEITPSSIELSWDDVIERDVSVQIPRTGDLDPGLSIRSITSEPPGVTVRGAKSMVEVLQFVRSVPLDVTGMSAGVHRQPLALENPPKFVAFTTDQVTAAVDITPAALTRQFSKVRVEAIGMFRATTVQPANVSVIVTGPPQVVSSLSTESIIPRVEPKAANIDTSQSGSAYLEVLIDVPNAKTEVVPPKVLVKW